MIGTGGGAASPRGATGVRLRLYVAGSCRHPGWVARRGGGARPVDFPALVALIDHPDRGLMLWDTGYAPRLREHTARLPAALYRWLLPPRCAPEQTAVAQLRREGIAPERVGAVILSHLHPDHVSGVRDFPAARIVASRAALAQAARHAGSRAGSRGGWRQLRAGVFAGLLPDDLAERALPVQEHPVRAVPGLDTDPGSGTGYDLVGDGTVVAVPLPGHTPGHLGLLVTTAGPRVLLAGDACWSGRALTHGELPHPLTRLVTDDVSAYRRTIAALARLQRRDPDLLVVPSHCPESIRRAANALAATAPPGQPW